MEARDLQELAAELDCTIVTVAYRLAPETTYRGSVEDNYASLVARQFAKNFRTAKVDALRRAFAKVSS